MLRSRMNTRLTAGRAYLITSALSCFASCNYSNCNAKGRLRFEKIAWGTLPYNVGIKR